MSTERCDPGGLIPETIEILGCNSDCAYPLIGFYCVNDPDPYSAPPQTVCQTICSDGIMADGEDCDDGNSNPGDGCSGCLIDNDYECKQDFGMKSICTLLCGNGALDTNEECDDYNQVKNDGCSECKID